MKHTIFNTPIISHIFHWTARGILRLKGWKITGNNPDAEKYVLIAAPHTSNWDFIYMLGVVFARRLDLHWMGKHTLFPRGLGWFMKWLGGVPVNRNKAQNTVSQIADIYKSRERFRLLLTPEGTRKKVDKWKTGFYRIADQAKVPLYLVAVDFPSKVVEFLPEFPLTGDMEADLTKIMELYAGKKGYHCHC